jgi:DegV family protein with EDD domain
MREYVLFTDSTTDISAAMAEELQLELVHLSWMMGDNTYVNYLDGREMSAKDFFNRLRNGEMASTTQVNPHTFVEQFRPHLEAGKDILYLGFSSGLSATFSSSLVAREQLLEEFPDVKIYCVDTLCASMGEGLLVWYAAQLKKAGKTIDEVRDWAEENKLRVCQWFTVDDLKHLHRGGRCSGIQAFAGSLLNIKPVLYLDDNGKLIPKEKVRNRKKALAALVEKMAENVEKPEEQVIFISHGDCLEEAEYVASLINEKWQVKDIVINTIGPVIGAHAGAGTMALFYLGKSR